MYAGMFHNNKGFTLAEMLLSLSVLGLIVTFIAGMTPLICYHQYSGEIHDQMEWEMFINQIKKEIRMSEKIEFTPYNRVLLWNGDRNILYEKYGNRIRRRVDGRGHQIILFKIKQFSYGKMEHGITITVLHENGRLYEAKIFLPGEIPVIDKK